MSEVEIETSGKMPENVGVEGRWTAPAISRPTFSSPTIPRQNI